MFDSRLSARRVAVRAVFAATLLCGGVGAFAETVLKAWNIHPDDYPVSEAMRSFADNVAKATGGRYRIDLHNAGVLGDQPKAVQMFKAGEIDIAEFNAGPLSDAAPGLKAFNLPFLFTDAAHMFRHLDGPIGSRLSAKLMEAGFVVLGWYDGGVRSFFCADKPIVRAQDLAGRRIRVQQSDVYIEMVKLLDAQPIVVPYKEVIPHLEQGKIDCAEGNMVSYHSTGAYKVAKYVYLDGHVVSPEALVVTTRLWNKLSEADRAAFKKAGNESALLMRELWKRRVAAAREVTAKSGVQFTPVMDASPLVRRVAPIYKKYMSDPEIRGELLTIIGQ